MDTVSDVLRMCSTWSTHVVGSLGESDPGPLVVVLRLIVLDRANAIGFTDGRVAPMVIAEAQPGRKYSTLGCFEVVEIRVGSPFDDGALKLFDLPVSCAGVVSG